MMKLNLRKIIWRLSPARTETETFGRAQRPAFAESSGRASTKECIWDLRPFSAFLLVLWCAGGNIAEAQHAHFNREIEKKLPGEHEFLTDRQNVEAVEFIERNKEEPFFLFLSHYAVHTQVHGKPDLVDHFRKKAARAPAKRGSNIENDPYKMLEKSFMVHRAEPERSMW